MDFSWAAPRAVVPFLIICLAGGAILGVVMKPWVTALVEAVSTSLFSVERPVYAQLSRASGLASYCLLSIAMLLGLLQSTRLARKWPGVLEAFELHRYISLLSLCFSVFHALVLAGDPRVSGRPALLFLPFAMLQAFPWSWWGQFALYGLVLASLSFYLRRHLGKKVWRVVHGLSICFYVMALVHSVGAGASSTSALLSGFYWVTGGSVALFSLCRGCAAALTKQRAAEGRRKAAAPGRAAT